MPHTQNSLLHSVTLSSLLSSQTRNERPSCLTHTHATHTHAHKQAGRQEQLLLLLLLTFYCVAASASETNSCELHVSYCQRRAACVDRDMRLLTAYLRVNSLIHVSVCVCVCVCVCECCVYACM